MNTVLYCFSVTFTVLLYCNWGGLTQIYFGGLGLNRQQIVWYVWLAGTLRGIFFSYYIDFPQQS
jgi:hypothetical protein